MHRRGCFIYYTGLEVSPPLRMISGEDVIYLAYPSHLSISGDIMAYMPFYLVKLQL
jgi:hypothetical protein